ncbi:hypothetical protein ACO2Q1_08830 [Brevundimonas sp. VNH65]|uniref:hypothetical protein n=1 Tax=Brevundimonas sp. VNH65 TaxID=3400917 RepID=UPI003C059F24
MNHLERIWLMQTPSRMGPAWREAFARACEDRGWAFAVHERGEPAPPPDPSRSQLTVSWLDWFEGQPVTRFYVQRGTADDSPDILARAGDLGPSEALYEGSLRLAAAELMLQNGADLIDMNDEVVTLQGLGDVSRPCEIAVSQLGSDHPLALYKSAPLKTGDSIRWPPRVFSYPGLAAAPEDGRIELLGRRRMLFNGPNIFLPPGRWRLDAEFSINPPARTELLIEWGFGEGARSLSVVIEHPGRYSVSLEQEWTRVAAADFRISLMIPALAGHLDFHGAVVTRIGDYVAPAAPVLEDAAGA